MADERGIPQGRLAGDVGEQADLGRLCRCDFVVSAMAITPEQRHRAHETLARLAARQSDAELEIVEPTPSAPDSGPGSARTQCEDGVYRTYDEWRAWKAGQKKAETEKALEGRLLAIMGQRVKAQRKEVYTTIQQAFDAFGEEAADAINKRFAKNRDAIKADVDGFKAELSADIRRHFNEVDAVVDTLATQAAAKAVNSIIGKLNIEIRNLHAEIAELKRKGEQP
ncbi:hypothetical protein ACIQUG_03505 [Ensifer sp. NPDC090286]|uniref:hypothetical protein n=1 Tax=Ensifer sp. NPDC090286 TaxID=3363991 RepID=UPI00383BCE85